MARPYKHEMRLQCELEVIRKDRDAVFLSLAVAFAETIRSGDIYIGVNALDYSGYPDCRPEFIAAFEAL